MGKIQSKGKKEKKCFCANEKLPLSLFRNNGKKLGPPMAWGVHAPQGKPHDPKPPKNNGLGKKRKKNLKKILGCAREDN